MKFVFDIDGTLCFDGRTIDASIVEALDTLLAAQHEVIFASARPIRDLLPVLPLHLRTQNLVGGNGCYISRAGEIEVTYFEQTLHEQLVVMTELHQLTYLADGDWHFSFTGDFNHPIYRNLNQDTAKNHEIRELEKICKLVLFEPLAEVVAELSKLPVALTHYKGENAVDISPLGMNKVKGLRQLGVGEFIAFGNDSNDRCMFEEAIFSVCVGANEVQRYASESIQQQEVAQTIIRVMEGL